MGARSARGLAHFYVHENAERINHTGRLPLLTFGVSTRRFEASELCRCVKRRSGDLAGGVHRSLW